MKPLAQVPAKYGAMAGLLGAALMIGLYFMGRHPFLIPVFFDFRVFLFAVFIFFSLKELRDFYYAGSLLFWEGIIASFVFVAIFALVSSVLLWIFAASYGQFVSDYVALQMEQLKNLPADTIESIGKDVYKRNLEMLPTTDASDLAMLYFAQSFLIGTFISIILSVILRKQPKP